jgi:hypothetical protein
MADLFQRKQPTAQAPITADNCVLTWEGQFAAAMQVSISYQQQVQRRRTIGNQLAALWATFPIGQINIARLLTSAEFDIFSKPGWDACNPAKLISFKMGECGGGAGSTLSAATCVVTSYNISAEAEGLTVIDNLVIEFLTLSA